MNNAVLFIIETLQIVTFLKIVTPFFALTKMLLFLEKEDFAKKNTLIFFNHRAKELFLLFLLITSLLQN